MNLKDIGQGVLMGAAIASLAYGVLTTGGWVISRAGATDVSQQGDLELQRKYDRQLLELDIRSLTTQINVMESKPDRSEWENEQIRQLRIVLDAKVKLLAGMSK